jgi:tetratricopeptide (TPR) repeat protein
MKFSALLPQPDLLEKLEEIEGGLRRRRRLGVVATVGFVLTAASQVMLLIESARLDEVAQSLTWGGVLTTVLYVGIPVLLLFFLLLLSLSRYWLEKSKQAFRYTCSISPFHPAPDSVEDPLLCWLPSDLESMLAERVGRLYFTERDAPSAGEEKGDEGPEDVSHISICGSYIVRKSRARRWVIEVKPRVAIGPQGSPETLAQVVSFNLQVDGTDGAEAPKLTRDRYEQLLERVYFTVTSEIYGRIQKDVEHKIDLLPTRSHRGYAYLHEADDYARSNTHFAYTQADRLYQRAIECFDPSRRGRPDTLALKVLHSVRSGVAAAGRACRSTLARARPTAATRDVLCARAEIGRARMIISRGILAMFIGRRVNPLFSAPSYAERAIGRLERLPEDVPGRTEALFEGYVALARSFQLHRRNDEAEEHLRKAAALGPELGDNPQRRARELYVRGALDPNLRTRQQFYQRASDLDPRFEIAHFELAYASEQMWRRRPTFERNVAERVIEQYEDVLRINQGNLIAKGSQGYIYWLLGTAADGQRAREAFETGRDYKSIDRDTSVACLDHGLARLAAEQGKFREAYEHYIRATVARHAEGLMYSGSAFSDYHFELIGPAMLARFDRYLAAVTEHVDRWRGMEDPEGVLDEALRRLAEAERLGRPLGEQDRVAVRAVRDLVGLAMEGMNCSDVARLRAWAAEQDHPLIRDWFPQREGIATRLAVDELSVEGGAASAGAAGAFRRALTDSPLADALSSALVTHRVRCSVMAFVTNDHADACWRYYFYTGDVERFRRAREGYLRAIELNPDYVVPYVGLANLSYALDNPLDRDELKETVAKLDPVTRLEKTWPEGKLIYARGLIHVAQMAIEEGGGTQRRLAKVKRTEAEALRAQSDAIHSSVETPAGTTRPEVEPLPPHSRGVPTGGLAGVTPPLTLEGESGEGMDWSGSLAAQPALAASGAEGAQWPIDRHFDLEVRLGIEALQQAASLEAQAEGLEEEARQLEQQSRDLEERAAAEAREYAERVQGLCLTELPGKTTREASLESRLVDVFSRDLEEDEVSWLVTLGMVRAVLSDPGTAFDIFHHVRRKYRPAEFDLNWQLRQLLQASIEHEAFAREEYTHVRSRGDYGWVLASELYPMLRRGQPLRLPVRIRSREYHRLRRDPVLGKLLAPGRRQELLQLLDCLCYQHCRDVIQSLFRYDIENAGYPYDILAWVSLDWELFAEPERAGGQLQDGKPRRGAAVRGGDAPGEGGCVKADPPSREADPFQQRRLRTLETLARGAKQPNRPFCYHERVGLLLEGQGMEAAAAEAYLRAIHTAGEALANGSWRIQTTGTESELRAKLVDLCSRRARLCWELATPGEPDRYGEALRQLDHIHEFSVPTPWRSEAARTWPVEAPEAYASLRGWMEKERVRARRQGSADDLRDAEAALVILRGRDPSVDGPDGWRSAATPLLNTPILVEGEASIYPQEDDWWKSHPLFTHYIPAVRQRISARTGITVPGINFRSDVAAAEGAYTILIDEARVAGGAVQKDRRFCADPALRNRLGLPATTFNPWTGRHDGAWLDAKVIADHALELEQTRDHFQYVTEHLHRVLLRHAASFVNLEEVAGRVTGGLQVRGDSDAQWDAALRGVADDEHAVARIAATMRALASELVPVSDFRTIVLRLYGGGKVDGEDDAVQAIRLDLRMLLPGNRAGTPVVRLAPEVEEEIRAGMSRDADGRPVLTMDPARQIELLGSFRRSLADERYTEAVIATHDPSIRPLVRRLIEPDHPDLAVLSSAELCRELRGTPAATWIEDPSGVQAVTP